MEDIMVVITRLLTLIFKIISTLFLLGAGVAAFGFCVLITVCTSGGALILFIPLGIIVFPEYFGALKGIWPTEGESKKPIFIFRAK